MFVGIWSEQRRQLSIMSAVAVAARMLLFIRAVKSQFGCRRNRRRVVRWRRSIVAPAWCTGDLPPPSRRPVRCSAWELCARQTVVAAAAALRSERCGWVDAPRIQRCASRRETIRRYESRRVASNCDLAESHSAVRAFSVINIYLVGVAATPA